MNTAILRLLWGVVEETRTSDLLNLSDRELVEQLVSQVRGKRLLNGEETNKIDGYLRTKILLIRDLAQTRYA